MLTKLVHIEVAAYTRSCIWLERISWASRSKYHSQATISASIPDDNGGSFVLPAWYISIANDGRPNRYILRISLSTSSCMVADPVVKVLTRFSMVDLIEASSSFQK